MPVFCLVLGVNLFVDPAHLFNSEAYVGRVAAILLKGKNVAGLSNYDERLLQKIVIENRENEIDTIVMGSSRAMILSNDLLHDGSFFNHAVSGATIEDYVAITQLFLDNGGLPDSVYIGVDPWLFNINNGQIRWKTLSKDYQKGLQTLNIHDSSKLQDFISLGWLDRWFEIVSPAYFQSSIDHLLKHKGLPDPFFETDSDELDVAIKKADGTISYDKPYRDAGVEQVQGQVKSAMNKQPYSLGSYYQIDPSLQVRFEALLHFLKSEGVEVTLILSPYHPLFYDFLITGENTAIILDVQKYIGTLGQDMGIPVIGSYDPADIPCKEEEFYDEMHPRPACFQKLIEP